MKSEQVAGFVSESVAGFSGIRNLRASGASWHQIAALLAASGVRSRSGQPMNEAVIRAMVSRAKREHLATTGGESPAADDHISHAVADSVISTPVQKPGLSARQRRPANASNTELQDVSERIRRASALRLPGGARHG